MRVRTTATRKRDGENELQDSPGERELACERQHTKSLCSQLTLFF